jgi:hypothetical protein
MECFLRTMHIPVSWRMWNIQSALDRGPREAAFEPSRYLPKAVEVDQFTRLIEPDQVAHLAKHRNVGDGIFVAHDPIRWPLA